LRRCIVTRERQDKARMIRFVVGPDRVLVPDLAGRLPGRGLWLSARADVLQAARARGAFARAARGPVTVPPDLSAMVRMGLARRVAELLGLARRAGQAVGGFQKARDWLLGGRAALVVQAFDASPAERARLLAGRPGVPVVTALSAEALGSVFGRDHVVHVAVASGRLADAIASEAERLAGVAGAGSQTELGGDWRSTSAGETNGHPALPGATD
jgi:predicted RNA-binding protein YlxR (DUF448 family)